MLAAVRHAGDARPRPWLPLLAIPFDAEVDPTPEASRLDAEASRGKLHGTVETFLERLLMMPTLHRRRGRATGSTTHREFLLAAPRRSGRRCAPGSSVVTTRPGVDPIASDGGHAVTDRARAARPDDAAEQLAIEVAAQFALSDGRRRRRSPPAPGGNPLFVRELVFAAQHGAPVDELPETVESLLTTRIDTLEPADRMLLRYASVVGPTFDLDLLGEILADEIPEAGEPGALGPPRASSSSPPTATRSLSATTSSARRPTRGCRSGGRRRSTAVSASARAARR